MTCADQSAHKFHARPIGELPTDNGPLQMAGLFFNGSYVTTFYGDTTDEAMTAADALASRYNAERRHANAA